MLLLSLQRMTVCFHLVFLGACMLARLGKDLNARLCGFQFVFLDMCVFARLGRNLNSRLCRFI